MEKIDFNEIKNSVQKFIQDYMELLDRYIRGLNQNEKIGWALNGAGILLLLVGIILW